MLGQKKLINRNILKKIHATFGGNLLLEFLTCMLLFLKVKMFRESQKNLAHLPHFIWHYLVASNYKWKMGHIFMAFSECQNFNLLKKWIWARLKLDFEKNPGSNLLLFSLFDPRFWPASKYFGLFQINLESTKNDFLQLNKYQTVLN